MLVAIGLLIIWVLAIIAIIIYRIREDSTIGETIKFGCIVGAIGAVPAIIWGTIENGFETGISAGIMAFIAIAILSIVVIAIIGKVVTMIKERIKEHKAKSKREAEERTWAAETEKLKQSALQGDVDTQYQLGERCRNKDLTEAIKWFEMAAGKGHKKAKEVLTAIEEEQKVREEAAKREAEEAERKKKERRQRYISEGRKCLTCEHWGGNAMIITTKDFEPFRSATGKCHCKGTTNYANNVYLSSDDSCSSWEKHSFL
ncbi:MAG: hypothetical protein LBQ38_02215 [Spirochaetaceae bacterium]|jgi:uncharacterized membrane protein|nr:hypothetical protein [Spirochaetaceae bacterium]